MILIDDDDELAQLQKRSAAAKAAFCRVYFTLIKLKVNCFLGATQRYSSYLFWVLLLL